MIVERDDLMLCECCTLAAVNGDASGCAYHCGDTHAAEVEQGLNRLGPHLVPHFDSDTDEGIETFSWTPCACCGSMAGGGRHRFAIDTGPVRVHGVARTFEVRCGDWRIRAEQGRSLVGSPDTFDVFAEHFSGARVPPGPNMHTDPDPEIYRLEKLLGWERKEPRHFSWLDRGNMPFAKTTLADLLSWKGKAHADCDCSGWATEARHG